MKLELARRHLRGIEHIAETRHRIINASHLMRGSLRSIRKRRQRYLALRAAIVVTRDRFRDGVVDGRAIKHRFHLLVAQRAGVTFPRYSLAAIQASGHAKSELPSAVWSERSSTEPRTRRPRTSLRPAGLCVQSAGIHSQSNGRCYNIRHDHPPRLPHQTVLREFARPIQLLSPALPYWPTTRIACGVPSLVRIKSATT